jgi:hypothetical protein
MNVFSTTFPPHPKTKQENKRGKGRKDRRLTLCIVHPSRLTFRIEPCFLLLVVVVFFLKSSPHYYTIATVYYYLAASLDFFFFFLFM